MLQWLTNHAELAGLVIQLATLAVWALYLHLLLMNFLRQRHSVILITRGTSRGSAARCLVTNMSAEPIYLLGTFVAFRGSDSPDTDKWIEVTERDELESDELNDLTEATNQGPLSTGEVRDIGDFATMERRARGRAPDGLPEQPEEMSVMVVAASGHAAKLVGCRQSFAISHGDEDADYVPRHVVPKQIRNLRRSRFRHLVNDIV